MSTRTRFVFLMHPKEFKHEKAATGRLTHLCLAESAIHCGVEFDDHEAVQAILRDPRNFPVLLYPGRSAVNLSLVGAAARLSAPPVGYQPREHNLVVLILDATWALGHKMLKLSPSLQRLPRVMFTPTVPSRFIIKQQPHAGCLSTLEAVHELLLALAAAGLDHYPRPDLLLSVFHRMQDFQIRCAADPSRGGYRRSAYSGPAERTPPRGHSGARRARVFQAPE